MAQLIRNRVLKYIERHPDGVAATELAKKLHASPSSITLSLAALQEEGLVYRPSPKGKVFPASVGRAHDSRPRAAARPPRSSNETAQSGEWGIEAKAAGWAAAIGLAIGLAFKSGILRTKQVGEHQTGMLARLATAGQRGRDIAERAYAGLVLWVLQARMPADPAEQQRLIIDQATENVDRQMKMLNFLEDGLKRAVYSTPGQQVSGLVAAGFIRPAKVDHTPQVGAPSTPLTSERAEGLRRLPREGKNSRRADSGVMRPEDIGPIIVFEPGPTYPFDFPPARAIAGVGGLIPAQQIGPLIRVLLEWVKAEKWSLMQAPALPPPAPSPPA